MYCPNCGIVDKIEITPLPDVAHNINLCTECNTIFICDFITKYDLDIIKQIQKEQDGN